MKMSGEEIIAAPRQLVWDALNDPEVLKQSITGCDEIKKKSDTEFEAKVTAKVGPVKASFLGAVKLSKLNPPRSYVISGEGKGGVAGFAKGGATVQLSDTADGQTKLSYDVDAQVGGKLAQIGSRLIDSTAKKMAADFFKKFNKIVSDRAQAAETEKSSKPAAKKSAAKKAATKKAAAKKTAVTSAEEPATKPAAKKAAAKKTAAASTAKPAARKSEKASAASAAKPAAKTAEKASKTTAKPAKKAAAKKSAEKSVAEESASAPSPASKAAAAAATHVPAAPASSSQPPASKAPDAMPPQAAAFSRLWLWIALAAIAGLILVMTQGNPS